MADTRVARRMPMDLLREDYRILRDLVVEAEQLTPEETALKGRLYSRIKSEFAIHSQLEEKLFYPALARMKDQGDPERIGVALQEHRLAEALIAALDRTAPRENRFDAILRLLASHIGRLEEQDESFLFPQAERMPRAGRHELLRQMEALRSRLDREKAE
jgi:hypothetical protein